MASKILLAVMLFGAAVVVWQRLTANFITGEQARQLVSEGALLVDVRSTGEFSGGHISGAINIPVHQLANRMAELEPKTQTIVVYCQSGARSSRAQKKLSGQGFQAVHNLGGIGRW